MNPDDDYTTPYLIEAVTPIREQLWDRLEIEPDEEDAIAVTTALVLAALAGFRQGTAAILFAASKQGMTITHSTSPDLERNLDVWAQRYGEEE